MVTGLGLGKRRATDTSIDWEAMVYGYCQLCHGWALAAISMRCNIQQIKCMTHCQECCGVPSTYSTTKNLLASTNTQH